MYLYMIQRAVKVNINQILCPQTLFHHLLKEMGKIRSQYFSWKKGQILRPVKICKFNILIPCVVVAELQFDFLIKLRNWHFASSLTVASLFWLFMLTLSLCFCLYLVPFFLPIWKWTGCWSFIRWKYLIYAFLRSFSEWRMNLCKKGNCEEKQTPGKGSEPKT